MAPGAAPTGERAGHAPVHRLGARRGEGEFIRAAADHLGGAFPSSVEQHPGPAARLVQPGRIGPPLVQRGYQSLAGDRVQGSG